MSKERQDLFLMYRQSRVYPLMRLLKQGVLHTTNVQGLNRIIRTGQIMPNKGDLPFSFPQSKTYYCFSIGAVCLFDFESAREEDYVGNLNMWEDFFVHGREMRIILKLDRRKLKDKLIPSSARPRYGQPGHKWAIAYVEVWYPEAIPVCAIDGYILTRWNSKERRPVFETFSRSQIEKLKQSIQLFRRPATDLHRE